MSAREPHLTRDKLNIETLIELRRLDEETSQDDIGTTDFPIFHSPNIDKINDSWTWKPESEINHTPEIVLANGIRKTSEGKYTVGGDTKVGKQYSLTITATDSVGDSLYWSIRSGSGTITPKVGDDRTATYTVTPTTAALSGREIKIVVADRPTGHADRKEAVLTLTLVVKPANTLPTWLTPSHNTLYDVFVDDTLTIPLTADDQDNDELEFSIYSSQLSPNDKVAKDKNGNWYYEYTGLGADQGSTYNVIFQVTDNVGNPTNNQRRVIRVRVNRIPTKLTVSDNDNVDNEEVFVGQQFEEVFNASGGNPSPQGYVFKLEVTDEDDNTVDENSAGIDLFTLQTANAQLNWNFTANYVQVFNVKLTVTDQDSTETFEFTLTVKPILSLKSPQTEHTVLKSDMPLEIDLEAEGGTQDYTWSKGTLAYDGGTLPAGSTASITEDATENSKAKYSFTSNTSGIYTDEIRISDSSTPTQTVKHPLKITVPYDKLTATFTPTDSKFTKTKGDSDFSIAIAITGGKTPYTVTATSGTLTGTGATRTWTHSAGTVLAETDVTITVSDTSAHDDVTHDFKIQVNPDASLTRTTLTFPDQTDISAQHTATFRKRGKTLRAEKGVPPYVWSRSGDATGPTIKYRYPPNTRRQLANLNRHGQAYEGQWEWNPDASDVSATPYTETIRCTDKSGLDIDYVEKSFEITVKSPPLTAFPKTQRLDGKVGEGMNLQIRYTNRVGNFGTPTVSHGTLTRQGTTENWIWSYTPVEADAGTAFVVTVTMPDSVSTATTTITVVVASLTPPTNSGSKAPTIAYIGDTGTHRDTSKVKISFRITSADGENIRNYVMDFEAYYTTKADPHTQVEYNRRQSSSNPIPNARSPYVYTYNDSLNVTTRSLVFTKITLVAYTVNGEYNTYTVSDPPTFYR